MKLKNNALQELYDTLVSGNPTISPYAESPFDKAFRECDEKIQKDNDILENSNNSVIDTNMKLLSERRKLEKEIEDLLSRTHHAEDEVEALKKDNEDLRQRLTETTATLEKANTDRTELQNDRDFYHGLYTEHRRDYDKLFEENKQIKKELHTAEEARNNLRAELEAKVKRMDEITKDRDFFFKMYHALKNDYKKLEAKYRDMKSYSNCYAEGYSDGKEEGEENLWDMLQNVNDSQPYDFDAECDGMEDVISMDLEDFLDTYKKWQEEKEKERLDHMRDYLARFCEGRVCKSCPLGSLKYKCGCGQYTLKNGKLFIHDLKNPIMPSMEKVNRGITKACAVFCKAVQDADIGWECTLEATVEVNKDLLEKVCGVQLNDK